MRAAPILALAVSGCFVADTIKGPVDVEVRACAEDDVFFAESVSPNIIERDCIMCHRSDGFAKESAMVLQTPETEGHQAHNLEVMRTVAATQIDGTSVLLLKPTLQLSHGGGQRFAEDSPSFETLEQLVFRFDNPTLCPPEDPGMQICDAPGPHPGPSPLRPLSSIQVEQSVRDLFRGRVDVDDLFPQTEVTEGFSTYVGANLISGTGAESILLAAETVSARAAADLDLLMECAPGETEEACFLGFVDRFGKRAYRRPLRDDERLLLESIYRLDYPLQEKVQIIVEIVLQSPQFLYMDETEGETVAEGVQQLDDYAIAQRLSYFFWDTMPDSPLFAAADNGLLSNVQDITAAAERMVDDPRAQPVIAAFHRDWLQTYRLEDLAKTAPEWSPELARSMSVAQDRFVQQVFNDGGSFPDLLTSPVAFSDTLLDPIYNTSSGAQGPGDHRMVTLPAAERAGLLTRAAFLTRHAYDDASSPINRGVFVIRNLFCQELVIPPGLEVGEPPSIEGSTARERLALHRDREACAACHDKIDPLGFSLERYDAIGRFRDQYENGREIDTQGNFPEPAIAFDGAIELTQSLVSTSLVRDCYARQWFRYSAGRQEQDDDCALQSIEARFANTGGELRDLMLAIATSDAFLFRRVDP